MACIYNNTNDDKEELDLTPFQFIVSNSFFKFMGITYKFANKSRFKIAMLAVDTIINTISHNNKLNEIAKIISTYKMLKKEHVPAKQIENKTKITPIKPPESTQNSVIPSSSIPCLVNSEFLKDTFRTGNTAISRETQKQEEIKEQYTLVDKYGPMFSRVNSASSITHRAEVRPEIKAKFHRDTSSNCVIKKAMPIKIISSPKTNKHIVSTKRLFPLSKSKIPH
jgi:hypothetical protein